MDKKQKKIIAAVGIIVFAIALITIVIFAKYSTVIKNRELIKGFLSLKEELGAYSTGIKEKTGFDEISKRSLEDKSGFNADLGITIPRNKNINIGIKLDSRTDVKNRRLESGLSLSAQGMQLAEGRISADDNLLYIELPRLSDNALRVNLDSFGRDFNASVFSDITDSRLDDDFSIDLFETYESRLKAAEYNEELIGILNESFADLKKAIVIKKTESRTVETADGSAECKGWLITIPSGDFNGSMLRLNDGLKKSGAVSYIVERNKSRQKNSSDYDGNDYSAESFVDEYFNWELGEDLKLEVFVDKKGRIAGISTAEDAGLIYHGSENDAKLNAGFNASLLGKTRALDTVNADITLDTDQSSQLIRIKRNADVDEGSYSENIRLTSEDRDSGAGSGIFSIAFENEWGYEDNSFDARAEAGYGERTVQIKAEGDVSDIIKNASYTINLDRVVLSNNSENALVMTGSMTIGDDSNPDTPIMIPDKSEDLFSLSSKDIYKMFLGLFNFR